MSSLGLYTLSLQSTSCSHIYAISESWLHSDISDDVITAFVPSHSIFRFDRTDRRAGGTVMLCNNTVHGNFICAINVIGIESV